MAAPSRPAGPGLHSLADATPGAPVDVVYVLFGGVRQHYEAAGIRAGTRLRVRMRTDERVLVELADGRMVEVEAVHAPFMEVRPHPSDAAAPPELTVRSIAAPRAAGGTAGGGPKPNPNPG